MPHIKSWCGCSGCGKTHLVTFLCQALGREWTSCHVHEGFLADDLIEFMNEAIYKAKELEQSEEKEDVPQQLWVFLDEVCYLFFCIVRTNVTLEFR